MKNTDTFENQQARWKAFLKSNTINQKECAEMMGISPDTLKTRIFTSKRKGKFPESLIQLMNFTESLEANKDPEFLIKSYIGVKAGVEYFQSIPNHAVNTAIGAIEELLHFVGVEPYKEAE